MDRAPPANCTLRSCGPPLRIASAGEELEDQAVDFFGLFDVEEVTPLSITIISDPSAR